MQGRRGRPARCSPTPPGRARATNRLLALVAKRDGPHLDTWSPPSRRRSPHVGSDGASFGQRFGDGTLRPGATQELGSAHPDRKLGADEARGSFVASTMRRSASSTMAAPATSDRAIRSSGRASWDRGRRGIRRKPSAARRGPQGRPVARPRAERRPAGPRARTRLGPARRARGRRAATLPRWIPAHGMGTSTATRRASSATRRSGGLCSVSLTRTGTAFFSRATVRTPSFSMRLGTNAVAPSGFRSST